MAELADAQDLGSCVFGRVGSSPTIRIEKVLKNQDLFCILIITCGNRGKII